MNFKLANILFGGLNCFRNYPALLYKTEKGLAVPSVDNADLCFTGSSAVDFTTYFNALSLFKWKKYSVAERFFLHFEYKGSEASFKQTYADNFDWEPVVVPESEMTIAKSDEWTEFDFELNVELRGVVHSFIIETQGDGRLRNAYYFTKIEASKIRPVELSLATTTFKKEDYILRNISLIGDGVLNSSEPIAEHFNLHVIDNGRTLDKSSLDSEHITIHPNPNVGGSGGFARGMIESMEQSPKATHVLLMDDDVEVLPESIIRTYNLLSLVKEKYSEAFLSGAMMSLEEPNLRTEDIGFFSEKGNFLPLKPAGYMTQLHDIIETEIYRTPTGLYGDTKQQYAGWWYCAIPMPVIEKNGLPLPLFVRSDDAEYALRCRSKIMSMNGICIWHNSFYFKYSAAVERYQVSRNTLISQATTGIAPMSDFLKEIHHEVQLDLKKFNYDDAALAVKGLEDFLRGPDFIAHPVAEERFMEANREKEKMLPLAEVQRIAEEMGIDLSYLTHSNLNQSGPRTRAQSARDFVTFNGQRFVNEKKKRHGKVAVIDAAGWVYPAGKIRDAETLIVIDMPNKKGAIRHMDKKRFKEIWSRYKRAAKEYEKRKEELYAQYASRCAEFTSVSFWKGYLKEAESEK